MSRGNLKLWSEQQQVAAVILLAGALIFALCFFLLLPQIRRHRVLERDIEQMRARLAQSNLLLGEDALVEHLRREQQQGDQLRQEWTETIAHLSAAPADAESVAVGSIDYKMALFEVERRLLKKGSDAGIQLPRDLGVREAVASDRDARLQMYQLRAVERLVNLAIDLDIKAVRSVQPLPVLPHIAEEGGSTFVEEYPVQMQFYGSLRNLYDFLHGSLERGTAMVLRNLQVSATSPQGGELLQVDTVMSMLVFVKDPAVMRPTTRPVLLVQPKGY